MKNFYEIKNITKDSADLYIYGEIVLESYGDWWTGEKSQTDVALMDFKQQLDDIGEVKNLNMYINSPGGSVFVASTMISMLQRLKDKGTIINAYVDGLSASAASFLMFVADNINLYNNSVVMVHRPMSIAYGNVDDMQVMINTLNKIEDSVLIPMYMKKAKEDVTEEVIKQLLAEETWMSSEDMFKYFNVTLLDDSKEIAACVDSKLFKNYKNAPKELIKNIKNEEKIESKNLKDNMDKNIIEKAKAKLNLSIEL